MRWPAKVWLLAAVTAVLALSGCGASSPVVVRVGQMAITKAALDRWTTIEAVVVYEPYPQRRAPKGVIPDPPSYRNCMTYLRALAAKTPAQPVPSTAQLLAHCRLQRETLQHQMLEILITSHWFSVEAARKGIVVTDGEARRLMDRKFVTPAALRRFLRLTGETEGDQEFLLRRTMLSNRLLKALARPGASAAQQQEAVQSYARNVATRWIARTDCRIGYIVAQCRQYRGS